MKNKVHITVTPSNPIQKILASDGLIRFCASPCDQGSHKKLTNTDIAYNRKIKVNIF